MLLFFFRLCLAASVLFGSACAGHRLRPTISPSSQPSEFRRNTHAVVLEHGQLAIGNPDLVSTLRSRVGALKVDETGNCRTLVLRRNPAGLRPRSLLVYVDGQRAADSCIIGMINPRDVERVEVYAHGVPPAPYHSNSGGVLLIFTRAGSPLGL